MLVATRGHGRRTRVGRVLWTRECVLGSVHADSFAERVTSGPVHAWTTDMPSGADAELQPLWNPDGRKLDRPSTIERGARSASERVTIERGARSASERVTIE